MKNANTEGFISPVADLVVKPSECMTLELGDVIVTGTPADVGYARTPQCLRRRGVSRWQNRLLLSNENWCFQNPDTLKLHQAGFLDIGYRFPLAVEDRLPACLPARRAG